MDGQDHVQGMQCLVDQDLRRVIHPARAQSVRTLKSEKVWCAENHFPKELLLVSLQLIIEERLSELHVRDHA